jgi:UDP-N-acetyl-D-glucosamine dehydrogenase
VVTKVTDALNRVKKSVNGSKILVLGVAYKKDIGDVRESPALDIIRLLKGKGAAVRWHDSHVAEVEDLNHASRVRILTARDLGEADCVVIVTDHSEYDWPWVVKSSALIVDTRNATAGIPHPDGKVMRL